MLDHQFEHSRPDDIPRGRQEAKNAKEDDVEDVNDD